MEIQAATPKNLEARRQLKEEEFHQKQFDRIPYRSYLSLNPLLRYLREKLEDGDSGEQFLAKSILDKVEQTPELGEPIKDPQEVLEKYSDTMALVLLSVVPPSQRESSLIKITAPFGTAKAFHTPRLERLFSEGKVEYIIDGPADMIYSSLVIRAASLILNKFYGQNISVDPPISVSIQPPGAPFARSYKTQFDLRFVDVVALKKPKPLSQDQINHLLSNIYDIDLWLKHLPPEQYEFHGLVIGNLIDITEEEALSQLKYRLLERNAVVDPDKIRELESLVRTFLNLPELRLGLTAIDYPLENSVSHKYKIRFDFLAQIHDRLLTEENKNSIYEKACRYKEVLLVEDLKNLQSPTPIERDLLAEGIRSIIVAPLFSKNNQVIGLLEIGSPHPYELHSFTELKFKALTGLFSMAVERSREEIDNRIEAIIREQFTAVHPSVEWRFIQSSYNLLERRERGEQETVIEPIVFNDVYPLYGQADIVSSSDKRNHAIQADLMDNLQRVRRVIDKALTAFQYPLLNQFRMKVDRCIEQLQEGFNSNDETIIVDMLREEIHPLLDNIQRRYPDLAGDITAYHNYLDEELGIVYKERKDFEDSISQLNTAISNHLEQQQKQWQQVLPHYFEKYKTDGVEYEMYVGQSLLNQESFCTMHLRNFRLWQLIDMCEITRLVDRMGEKLPVPLETAQLIFAYTTTLSIRFRMDEKQFDVDGAYNVRYEILKKRIDKALIDGTNERLTQSGKIAIVYLQEKDKQEYLEYFDYLQHEGYITDEIEDLTIGKLQGVQGLRALRITVAGLEQTTPGELSR